MRHAPLTSLQEALKWPYVVPRIKLQHPQRKVSPCALLKYISYSGIILLQKSCKDKWSVPTYSSPRVPYGGPFSPLSILSLLRGARVSGHRYALPQLPGPSTDDRSHVQWPLGGVTATVVHVAHDLGTGSRRVDREAGEGDVSASECQHRMVKRSCGRLRQARKRGQCVFATLESHRDAPDTCQYFHPSSSTGGSRAEADVSELMPGTGRRC